MRFLNFKEFRPDRFIDPSIDSVVKYLTTDMVLNLRQLAFGLQRLGLSDNFESFIVELIIDAGEEKQIVNKLENAIPSSRVILRSDEAGLKITDGPTKWTTQFLYLKNYGLSQGTIKVIFLK